MRSPHGHRDQRRRRDRQGPRPACVARSAVDRRRARGAGPGQPSRPPATPARPRTRPPLVEPTGAAGRDWDAPPAETSIDVFADVRAGARRGLRRARGRAAAAVRLRRARADDHATSASSTGAAAAARPADRPDRAQRQVPRLRPLGLGRARPPATSPTSTWPRSTPSWPSGSAGRERPGRPARRALRDAAAADRGRRPDDLPVLDRRRRGTPTRAAPSSPRPGGGTRIGERLSELPLTLRSDPAAPGLESRAVRDRRTSSGGRRRSSTTACRSAPTDWITDGELTDADPHPALGRDRPAPADARRRQPDPRGAGAPRAACRRWSPRPSAACC